MPRRDTVPKINWGDIAPEPAQEVLAAYSTLTEQDLIPVLQDMQDAYGYLPRPVLELISRSARIPLSKIHGVITFYAQFYLTPHGRHTIKMCQGTACHVKGGKAVLEEIKKHLNVEEGGTSTDLNYTLEIVACLGVCFLSPVMMIDRSYFGDLTPQDAVKILDDFGTSRLTERKDED